MLTVRSGRALMGVAGALALTGCSGAADADTGVPDTAPVVAGVTASYADDTYTAEGVYRTPETVETVSVTLTLVDDVVTDVEVTGRPQTPETHRYQGRFIDGIAGVVVGKRLDELDVDRVAGSSLTGDGFDQAVARIRMQAAVGAER